jgi:hypothetical protein
MNRTFSRSGYADLLNTARSCGYDIRPIRDALRDDISVMLLLRHDVDLSLRLALDMAQFEHERGIAATYYVLPYNDFYSPFSADGRRALLRMAEMGHEVGLHCDGAIYPEEKSAFQRAVRRDIEMLEDIIGQKVVSASQHSPIDTRPIDFGDLIEIDPYAAWIMEKFAYVSDSAMSWRSATPWDLLQSGKSLQLLIHPVWWMAPGANRDEKFQYLKGDATAFQVSKLEGTQVYIEQCLADRERLDALAAQRRGELHGQKAVKVSDSRK